jgi:hypothetical protein
MLWLLSLLELLHFSILFSEWASTLHIVNFWSFLTKLLFPAFCRVFPTKNIELRETKEWSFWMVKKWATQNNINLDVIYWTFCRERVNSRCLIELNFRETKLYFTTAHAFLILQKWTSCKYQVSFRTKFRWSSKIFSRNGLHICINRTSAKLKFKYS